MCSFDIINLFTNVPIEYTLNLIERELKNDGLLKDRTNLSIKEIINLLKFCMYSTVVTFNDKFYLQSGGCPMGCSLSPIIAEALVQHIFKTASINFPNPPRVLKFFVDDSFLILKRSSLESFFDYINNFNKELKSIKFTKEVENPEGVLPFLDLHIMRVNNTLQTRVYRKATHSNRYLNFESYHPLENKKSTIPLQSLII